MARTAGVPAVAAVRTTPAMVTTPVAAGAAVRTAPAVVSWTSVAAGAAGQAAPASTSRTVLTPPPAVSVHIHAVAGV